MRHFVKTYRQPGGYLEHCGSVARGVRTSPSPDLPTSTHPLEFLEQCPTRKAPCIHSGSIIRSFQNEGKTRQRCELFEQRQNELPQEPPVGWTCMSNGRHGQLWFSTFSTTPLEPGLESDRPSHAPTFQKCSPAYYFRIVQGKVLWLPGHRPKEAPIAHSSPGVIWYLMLLHVAGKTTFPSFPVRPRCCRSISARFYWLQWSSTFIWRNIPYHIRLVPSAIPLLGICSICPRRTASSPSLNGQKSTVGEWLPLTIIVILIFQTARFCISTFAGQKSLSSILFAL